MNETLPQPPPDAPLPPPSEAAIRSQLWRNWIVGVGILSVIIVLGICLFSPLVIRSRKKADLAQARSNLRQVGDALMEFDAEYGCFPDPETAVQVQSKHPGNTIPLGTSSSNDFFRQLIAAEIATSEVMFYAKMPDTRMPDNVIVGSRALEKGECGFAYVLSPWPYAGNTPLAFYPIVRGRLLFDYKICKDNLDSKAVLLLGDGSVMCRPVDKSGHVKINGKDLFDPTQPFWGGKTPVVKWPE